jgi:hypothetical protein
LWLEKMQSTEMGAWEQAAKNTAHSKKAPLTDKSSPSGVQLGNHKLDERGRRRFLFMQPAQAGHAATMKYIAPQERCLPMR